MVPGSLRAKEHVANSYLALDALATAERSVGSFRVLDALVIAGRSVADEMECLAVGMLAGLGTLAHDVVSRDRDLHDGQTCNLFLICCSTRFSSKDM